MDQFDTPELSDVIAAALMDENSLLGKADERRVLERARAMADARREEARRKADNERYGALINRVQREASEGLPPGTLMAVDANGNLVEARVLSQQRQFSPRNVPRLEGGDIASILRALSKLTGRSLEASGGKMRFDGHEVMYGTDYYDAPAMKRQYRVALRAQNGPGWIVKASMGVNGFELDGMEYAGKPYTAEEYTRMVLPYNPQPQTYREGFLNGVNAWGGDTVGFGGQMRVGEWVDPEPKPEPVDALTEPKRLIK